MDTWYTMNSRDVVIPFHALAEDVTRQMIRQRRRRSYVGGGEGGPLDDLMMAMAWENFLIESAHSEAPTFVPHWQLDKRIEVMEDCLSHADLSMEAIYRSEEMRQEEQESMDRLLVSNELEPFYHEEGKEMEELVMPIDAYISLYSKEKVNKRFINARYALEEHFRSQRSEE